MNDYTKKQLAIISNITNYDNEKDLNEGINNIQNMIIKNGNSWYNIDKILIINIAKNKRNIVGQKVWNNVKSNFGKLLKIIKYISKKEKLIDKILNKNNNGVLYKYSFLTNYSSLKKINIFPKYKVKKIATGGNHMLILTNNNLVYTYGSNTFGQLGYKSNFNLPMIDRSYTFKCLNDIPNKFKIVDISCGHAFSFLISENLNPVKQPNRKALQISLLVFFV